MNAEPAFERAPVRTAAVSSDTGDDTGSTMTAAGGTTSSHGPDERVPVQIQAQGDSHRTTARSTARSEPETDAAAEQDDGTTSEPPAQQDTAAPILPKTRRIARLWLDMMNDALSSRRSGT